MSVYLRSHEGHAFAVARAHAQVAGLVRAAPNHKSVVVRDADPDTIRWIAAYMTHHAGRESGVQPDSADARTLEEACVDPWDAAALRAFCGTGHRRAHLLHQAAGDLDMPVLLDLVRAYFFYALYSNCVLSFRTVNREPVYEPMCRFM